MLFHGKIEYFLKFSYFFLRSKTLQSTAQTKNLAAISRGVNVKRSTFHHIPCCLSSLRAAARCMM